ncbi:MAG: DinB family protein [Pyrinomonadaceae bacterium]
MIKNAPKTVGKTVEHRNRKQPVDLGRALVEAFLTNERIGQLLLDLIDPKIWRASPPCSKRRNIATTFAHMHNVRVMRLGMSSKKKRPARLDRADVTKAQAKHGLAESAQAMALLVKDSLAAGAHVHNFRPDVVALVCAAINHEAHHRGQISHWARQLGAPIPLEVQLELWDWNKRWKEVVGE